MSWAQLLILDILIIACFVGIYMKLDEILHALKRETPLEPKP